MVVLLVVMLSLVVVPSVLLPILHLVLLVIVVAIVVDFAFGGYSSAVDSLVAKCLICWICC